MAKCKYCGAKNAEFQAGLSKFCNFEEAAKWAYENKAKGAKVIKKEVNKKDRAAKAVLNQTVKYWRPKADTAFQLFSRLSKFGEPCYSCGTTKGQMHGGHYISKGAKKTLTRYAEDNCNPQCSTCNERLSGNIALYRPYLLKKIGPYRLSLLEGPMPLVKWYWDDYKKVYDWYNTLNNKIKRELKNVEN